MPFTLHAARKRRKIRVFHQGLDYRPEVPQKARQISSFCVYAAFIFHLIIARPGGLFLAAGASISV
jgi:hypothetical protein